MTNRPVTRAASRQRAWRTLPLLVVAIAALVAGAGAWDWLRPKDRPSVILITIDTLRADHLGSYGDREARTPTLDALAGRGARFANTVSHARTAATVASARRSV